MSDNEEFDPANFDMDLHLDQNSDSDDNEEDIMIDEPEQFYIESDSDESVDIEPSAPSQYVVADTVNRRAGHIGVEYADTALIWGGYQELPVDLMDHIYCKTEDLWQYCPTTCTWTSIRTFGDVPSRCSGAAGCIVDDDFYIIGGFHQFFNDNGDPVADLPGENSIWKLDLTTRVWQKLSPTGDPPIRCDKNVAWSYRDRVYVFGGFGVDPFISNLSPSTRKKLTFTPDLNEANGLLRGWTNQLVYYDISTNSWVWPMQQGEVPSPRAAHSAACIGNKVYIFGGRHMDTRMNDLYCLDLDTYVWSNIFPCSPAQEPIGRSWHSLSAIDTGKPQGGLLLYGGFDNDKTVLGDAWKLDFSDDYPSWTKMEHLHKGPRLWHTSVLLKKSIVLLCGGLSTNILSPNYVRKYHPKEIVLLNVAPQSLKSIALDFCSKNKEQYNYDWSELPEKLRDILKKREGSCVPQ